MTNYVAIGTSISMGWFDDGVYYGSQDQSRAKQFADDAGVPFTSPSISAPGCQPPLVSPIAAFARVADFAQLPTSCRMSAY